MLYLLGGFLTETRFKPMTQQLQEQGRKRLLGVFICLSFALQSLCFPLHLALVHHCHGVPHETAETAVAHSHPEHHEHVHDHIQHSEGKPSDDEHRDHPDEDHAKFLPSIATAPGSVTLVAAELLLVSFKLFEPSISCRAVAPRDAPVLRLHAKRISSPRAPPICA